MSTKKLKKTVMNYVAGLPHTLQTSVVVELENQGRLKNLSYPLDRVRAKGYSPIRALFNFEESILGRMAWIEICQHLENDCGFMIAMDTDKKITNN